MLIEYLPWYTETEKHRHDVRPGLTGWAQVNGTSHVHMMLDTALTEMIDNTECIMFYNTPNSVLLADDLQKIKNEKKKVTLSPWIYHELAMTSLVRICKPSRTIQLLENALVHKAFSEYNDINIEHGKLGNPQYIGLFHPNV